MTIPKQKTTRTISIVSGYLPRPRAKANLLFAGALAMLVSCTPNPSPPPPDPSANTPGSSTPTAGATSTATTISYEEWLANRWQGEGDPPEPLPVVREVTAFEFLKVHSECMATYGWIDENPSPEGSAYSVPEGQGDNFNVADFQCTAQYPEMPKYYQPFNRAQLEYLHNRFTGQVTDCLRSLGHDVPEPPSREKFISDWENDVTPRWVPWDLVPDKDHEAAEKQCDYYPPEFYDLATTPN